MFVELLFKLLLQLIQNQGCTLIIFGFVLCLSKWLITINSQKSPPGPWGVPILGYMPFLGVQVHHTLFKLAQKFGKCFQFSLGTRNIVVLSDPALIREAFKKEEFAGRPSTKLFDMFQGYGLMNIDGLMWKDQRKFVHEKLRSFGMKNFGPGRKQMENRIMIEVEHLLQSLASEKSAPVIPDTYMKNASANVICSILMSKRFHYNNPTFIRFMKLHDEGFKLFVRADIANYVPIVSYLSSFKSTFEKLKDNHAQSSQLLRDIIKERRETFDPNQINDILDSYLLEEHRAHDEGRNVYQGKDFDKQLVQILGDLFSAGEETVQTCLRWAMVFLLHYPEVMHKIQQELDTVVGRQQLPSLDDVPYLPYTEATICEILRRSSIVPLGTPHATTVNTTFSGYQIPKGTTIIPLLYNCNMDPELWTDPEKFEPERFLNEQGRVQKPVHFIPFGVGRRICLGDVLARSEIFLFLSSILHVYNLKCPDGEDLPSLEGEFGSTSKPKPFKMQFIPREESFDMANFETTCDMDAVTQFESDYDLTSPTIY